MAEALRQSLLHDAPARVEPHPRSRWSYTFTGMLIASVFVAYHGLILLIWCMPRTGLAKPFHDTFVRETKAREYFGGTHNSQSWEMFAPNPVRINSFVRVFVEDQDGELWDYGQDIWGQDRYPYLWYDRRGKINRRIDGKKHYQRIYGAWVCREWERTHAGVPAKSVTFVRRVTHIPPPDEIFARGGWDQWAAPYEDSEQQTITCRTTLDGQLPNELRARYGLEPTDESELRSVKIETWWDRQARQPAN